MKTGAFLLAFLTVLTLSCNKEKKQNCESFLVITKASVSPSSSVASGILFDLEAYGGNLCYSFNRLEISKTGDKTYDIRVIANLPCKAEVCAQALYQSNPSGSIGSLSAGTYTLRFFNDSELFTSIPVTIN
jgi:hypothetical protein